MCINENAISYEHRFSQKSGVEVMGGQIFSNPDPNNLFISELFRYNGVVGRIGLKLYTKHGKARDSYLEPMVMYKYISYSHLYVPVNSSLSAPEAYVQSKFMHVGEIAIIWGKEYYIFNTITLDNYIGVGLRLRFHKDIRYVHDLPKVSYIPEVLSPEERINSFEVFPVLKLGLKIGFGFTSRAYL